VIQTYDNRNGNGDDDCDGTCDTCCGSGSRSERRYWQERGKCMSITLFSFSSRPSRVSLCSDPSEICVCASGGRVLSLPVHAPSHSHYPFFTLHILLFFMYLYILHVSLGLGGLLSGLSLSLGNDAGDRFDLSVSTYRLAILLPVVR
jgi:hypothetical protein